jgi:hypothetical protein
VLLPVPEDIINFEIQAFAGPSQESLDGQIKEGSIPWFQISGKNPEENQFSEFMRSFQEISYHRSK